MMTTIMRTPAGPNNIGSLRYSLSNSIAGNTGPIGSAELMLLIIFYIVDVVGGEGHHQLVFDE